MSVPPTPGPAPLLLPPPLTRAVPAPRRCKAYNTVAVAVPREPVLYEFGGELIDRAAWLGGDALSPPWGGGEVPAQRHARLLPAAKERKGMKDKKKKGKGLKKKSPAEFGELSHDAPATHAPPGAQPGSGAQDPLPDRGEAAGGSRKRRRRKERNRKKRLKSKAEPEAA